MSTFARQKKGSSNSQEERTINIRTDLLKELIFLNFYAGFIPRHLFFSIFCVPIYSLLSKRIDFPLFNGLCKNYKHKSLLYYLGMRYERDY